MFGEHRESKAATFQFAEGDVEACRSKADRSARRHSRPNRIIIAVEGSISAGVGGESNVAKKLERKKCKAKQKAIQRGRV